MKKGIVEFPSSAQEALRGGGLADSARAVTASPSRLRGFVPGTAVAGEHPRGRVLGALPCILGTTWKPQGLETDCRGDLMLPRSRIEAAVQLGYRVWL